MIYISAYSSEKNAQNVKMGLSYRKLFALPELQASQKFRVHAYVDRPQTQLRELEEVKDCRYKLKEAKRR